MPGVAVVTDSTSGLTEAIARQHGIGIVPVQVVVGGRTLAEGRDINSQEVAAAMRSGIPVSTSRPAPGEFLRAYEEAVAAGAEHIVSVHLSGELSGTIETATLAARSIDVDVTVIDSRTLGMSLGYSVLAGVQSAEAGESAEAVARQIEQVAAGSTCLFMVDDLVYLRRGGRLSRSSAAIGSALRVKPILEVKDGQVVALEKARTSGRALRRLAELTADNISAGPHRIAVQHLDAPERAEELTAALKQTLGEVPIDLAELGAVIGAHAGPGTVSVACAPMP